MGPQKVTRGSQHTSSEPHPPVAGANNTGTGTGTGTGTSPGTCQDE
jgi:hypothetical protein